MVHRAENGLRNRKRRGIRALRWLKGIPTERGDDFPRFDGLRFFLGAFCAENEADFCRGARVVAVSRRWVAVPACTAFKDEKKSLKR